ncbi:hydrogenase maturation nickel metallochaperone HypA [Emergencia sp.]|uniref:hydrogenase maturation nickel metallochaperone HypA n=1 Tax=Emergencia sp. TaxID=1926557 RepID=UPI003AEF51E8
MHEFGIVVHVVDTLEKLAVENDLSEIASVTLEIGEVSSVLPDYIVDAWQYLHKKSDVLADAELKIEKLPAVSICLDCKKTYPTLEGKKQCPHCGGFMTELVSGDEFNIKEIEGC